MEIEIYRNLERALEDIITPDQDWTILYHRMNAGEFTQTHLHKLAHEYIIFHYGQFQLTVGDEKKDFDLKGKHPIVIHLPPNLPHALIAVTQLSYFVLRDRRDETFYIPNTP